MSQGSKPSLPAYHRHFVYAAHALMLSYSGTFIPPLGTVGGPLSLKFPFILFYASVCKIFMFVCIFFSLNIVVKILNLRSTFITNFSYTYCVVNTLLQQISRQELLSCITESHLLSQPLLPFSLLLPSLHHSPLLSAPLLSLPLSSTVPSSPFPSSSPLLFSHL